MAATRVILGTVDLTYDAYDVRTRTTLVCGAIALVIALSTLLRGRVRAVHGLFAGFAGAIAMSYLSQSLFGFYQSEIWNRARVALAVVLPVFAVNLFEAMVPDEDDRGRHSRFGRLSLMLALPMLVLTLSPYLHYAPVRIGTFVYSVVVVAAGLWELGQRGTHSGSRATQRRVRFLVITGALAGTFTVADFAWVIGYEPAYAPPPVGVVLSVVFLFVLAQALRHERLFDLSEMLGRLLVASATAFVIGGLFYVMVAVVGQVDTMWLNAVLAAIVVLVLYNPLRDWVEKQIHRVVFRDVGRLAAALHTAQRRLTHTLEIDEMGTVVMAGLERSRSVTSAALYLLVQDGSVFESLASIGEDNPQHVDVATAHALLEHLDAGPVVLEQVRRDAKEGRPWTAVGSPEAVLAAAGVLGPLSERAVVLGIRSDEHELMGLLVVADDRIGDAFSPEDVGLLDNLAAQVGVVVENSRVYAKMKERDRLAMLGQMAAGLAHEIRNPLGAIKGAAQLLADPGPGRQVDEPSREFLGIILEEVERLDKVVGSVLDLSRQNSDSEAPIDVNPVVRRTVQVMSTEWADLDIDIDVTLEEELPRAAIAPERLKQVLINLLRNAVQALAGKGRIRVTTRARSRFATRGVTEERWVVIGVGDEGPGISPAALKNIFMPFFTTKEEGTGLGLAVCERIVQGSGGRIEVRTREGEGTTFDVILPVAPDRLSVSEDASGAPEAVGPS